MSGDRFGDADGHTALFGGQHVLLESDGKLLVLSTNTTYLAGSFYSWTLSRHMLNTARDNSFGRQGEVHSRCKADGASFVDASQSIWVERA